MKEYDIVIEGEHISFESRHLRFGELQKDCHNEKVNNCADFDDGDFGKWFRLDKATVYIQEYDDNGDSEIISYLYKDGQAVDTGFVSETILDSASEVPVCTRIALRDCAAWGEFDDDNFEPDQLKIINAQKIWGDGEKRECIIGFEYRGREILIMDETDAETYDYFLSLGGKMLKISEDPDGIRTALDKIDEFNSEVYTKKYVEFEDGEGNIRGFYKLGYFVSDDGTSDLICVAPEELPDVSKRCVSPVYQCFRVQEWNVRYSPEIQSDVKGEYVEFALDSKSVAVIEKAEFFYSFGDDKVYDKSEQGKFVAPITLKQYDGNKAMAAIVGGRVDKDTCLKMLWDLDSHDLISRSNVPNECLTNIWLSNDVSIDWKYRTLKDLSGPKHNASVLTIPFEYEVFALPKTNELWQDEDKLIPCALLPEFLEGAEFSFEENHALTREHILWLLLNNRLSSLDKLAANGELTKFSDKDWNEIALCFILLANYDHKEECGENGADCLDMGLSWLDRYKQGLLVDAKDCYGNNMAMYVFAGMVFSVKSSRESWLYDRARVLLETLGKFGVDACQVNQFGVSAQMVYGVANR